MLDRVSGSKLCFGEPIQSGARTVIPVSRVRVAGGWGWGGGGDAVDSGEGGGGGGTLDAMPLGYIELEPHGTQYVQIPDPERTSRLLLTGAKAAATVLTAVAGARGARALAARRPKGLLKR
jgi:uncharacterized spore protein YtfJ